MDRRADGAGAQVWLTLGHVAELSLDHDMGVCEDCVGVAEHAATLCCPHVPTGLDLVRWMVATDTWPRTKSVVHSQNPIGATTMRAEIERAWREQ